MLGLQRGHKESRNSFIRIYDTDIRDECEAQVMQQAQQRRQISAEFWLGKLEKKVCLGETCKCR